MKTIGMAILVGIIFLSQLHAQTTALDSIVQITAAEQGLQLVDQVPICGTFWVMSPDGLTPVPFPCPPNGSTSYPVFQIADGQFIVDATGGQVAANSTLETQANAVVDLINRIQGTQLSRQMTRAFGMNGLSPDGSDGSGDGGDYTNSYSTYSFDTNLLWISISNVLNGFANANLHNATGQVYAIWSSISLATPFSQWQVETEVWPTDTNCMPFIVPMLGRQDLFLRAEDWTGVDSDGDGVPDWWAWLYWGTANLTDTNLDYSGNGNTFAQDYAGSNTPTVFAFSSIDAANNYVNSTSTILQLNVAGNPFYIATLIDDTNLADAAWTNYSSSNVFVNLGITEGWHQIWIGLRGHGDPPVAAVWQWKRLKVDFTPPALFITGPTNSTVAMPLIQLTGYSPEALDSISYELSNALGTITNQPVLVQDQHYDATTCELTTNTFQAYDVPLTNGLNVFTIHATDLAGNVTTLITNIVFQAGTNPPDIQFIWPQNAMKVCGDSFTLNGWTSDPTAAVIAQTVNGTTNTFTGRVGRDGQFYIENLPLNNGTNLFTLVATNVAGATTTNLAVIQGDVGLVVDPIPSHQANVTGKINSTNYTVWVNGMMATTSSTPDGDGAYAWGADNVPMPPRSSLVQVTAIPNSDHGGYGSWGGGQ